MRKLNLGCGNDIKKGYVNLDKFKLLGVNVAWDLEKFPYPFKDREFDEILCKDVTEHLNNFMASLKELHRILKPKGKITIQVPHFTSVDNFSDPTHKHMFSSSTFDSLLKSNERSYYFDFHFSKVKSKILFRKKASLFYGYFMEPLVNISKNTQLFYECTSLRSLFPAFNIEVILEK